MRVIYNEFAKDLGFDYTDREQPFYLKKKVVLSIINDEGTHYKIIIGKGFRSDGCTIPKIFWVLIGCPHTPQYISASIIHDALIKLKHKVKRADASLAFKTILLQNKVNPIIANIMYIAVDLYQKYIRQWT